MKKCVMLIVLLLVVVFLGIGAQAQTPLIYVVHSYNPETFGWTAEEYAGILKGFEQQGLVQGTHYEIVSDTMDAHVNSSEEDRRAEADRILNDIRKKQPALIMTTDDDALKWVGLAIQDIPVVFNGVNGDPTAYLTSPQLDSIEKPGHNITGVYQTTYFKQSLEFVQQLVPEAKTFAAITDRGTTSFALMKALQQQKDSLPLEMKDSFMSGDFLEWQAKIQEWQSSVDAIFILTASGVRDSAGNVLPSHEVPQWIAENSTLPDTASWAYQIQAGILVAATDSSELQGVHSAFLAAKILDGADPGSLPIVTPPNGVPALNGTRAEKLQLELPPDLLTIFIEFGQIFE